MEAPTAPSERHRPHDAAAAAPQPAFSHMHTMSMHPTPASASNAAKARRYAERSQRVLEHTQLTRAARADALKAALHARDAAAATRHADELQRRRATAARDAARVQRVKAAVVCLRRSTIARMDDAIQGRVRDSARRRNEWLATVRRRARQAALRRADDTSSDPHSALDETSLSSSGASCDSPPREADPPAPLTTTGFASDALARRMSPTRLQRATATVSRLELAAARAATRVARDLARLKAASKARESRAALEGVRSRREIIARRLHSDRDLARAAAARDAVLRARAAAAQAHSAHVHHVWARVRAARLLQAWLRRNRIRRLGRGGTAAQPAPPQPTPPPTAPSASSTAAVPRVTNVSPPRAPVSVAAVARVVRTLVTKLASEPVLTASTTLLHPLCTSFTSFEAAAEAVQDHTLLTAAQTVLTAITVAASKLDASGYATLLSATAAIDNMQDALSPQLRPLLARSARTLLAAMLIVDFKNDILGVQTPHVRDHAAAAADEHLGRIAVTRDAADDVTQRLHAAATQLLGALAQMLLCEHSDAPVAVRDAVRAHMPDGNLDTSAFVPPLLRTAIADEPASLRLHFMSTFTHAWVVYMDAFMLWKTGDGARMAQSLTRPYRRLLLKMAAYDREAASTIGSGDAGLYELRAGTSEHLEELRRQIVALIGSKAALQWEKEQRAAVEMEARVMTDSPAMGPIAAAPTMRVTSTPPRRTGSAPTTTSVPATHPRPPVDDASVPPGAATAPRAALFRDVVRNVELAHEIMLSPDFRFPSPPQPHDLGEYMHGGVSSESVPPTAAAMLQSLISVARQSPGFTPSAAFAGGLTSADMGPTDGFSLGPAAVPPPSAAAAVMSVSPPSSDRTPLKQSVHFWSMFLTAARDVVGGARSSATPARDVEALVTLLRSCRDCILEFYTHAHERRAHVEEAIDVDHVERMLTAGAFSHADWLTAIHDVLNTLLALEAPARNESTREWVRSFDAFVSARAAAFVEAKLSRTATAAPSTVDQRLDAFLLAVLPVAAAFVHWKAAQVRVDMANAHVLTLAPYLSANGHGVEYERRHFLEAAAVRGTTAHAGTRRWLHINVPSGMSVADADSHVTRLSLIRDGIIQQLLPLDVPFSSLTAAIDGCARLSDGRLVPIPLTLQLDARRITNWQNTVQTVALTATLGMLAQQLVADLPAGEASDVSGAWPPAADDCSGVAQLQKHIYTCLCDDSITMVDVRVSLLSDVRAWSAHAGKSLPASPALFVQAIDRAVSTQHPLYTVMQRRLLDVLRRRVTSALHCDFIGSAAADAAAARTDVWGALLSPLPAALAAVVPACAQADVDTLVRSMARLVSHNVAVHVETYRQLLRELVTTVVVAP